MTAANSKEENNIGLFVAWDAGVKWGASLVYSKSENDEAVAADQSEQKAMRTRLGVILNNGLQDFFSESDEIYETVLFKRFNIFKLAINDL
jgi:hypothetical protein